MSASDGEISDEEEVLDISDSEVTAKYRLSAEIANREPPELEHRPTFLSGENAGKQRA